MKVLCATALGFPLVVMLFEITDNLDTYLSRGIEPATIALAYLYSMPDKLFLVLPAAVLFATVFSVGTMSRHSELTASKATGRSFHRTVLPLLAASVVTAGAAVMIGELAPVGTIRQLELLGDREIRSQTARYNFVYRADQGWVYAIRGLEINQRTIRHAVFQREGRGPDYPTLALQFTRAEHDSVGNRWMVHQGRFRILASTEDELTFAFDSLVQRSFVETPGALLTEPKDPKEMRYAELGRYIDDLERSGGDGRKLRVRQELKLAIPGTCLIIALFGAPLALTAPRGSGAVGVGLSLGVTIVFLTLIQLSEAVGAGGLLPPTAAAWAPNVLFGLGGLVMLKRAPT